MSREEEGNLHRVAHLHGLGQDPAREANAVASHNACVLKCLESGSSVRAVPGVDAAQGLVHLDVANVEARAWCGWIAELCP